MDKKTYKVLKYIAKREIVTYQKLFSKFKNLSNPSIQEIDRWLLRNKLIISIDGTPDGLGGFSNPTKIKISENGRIAVRNAQFIDLDYWIKNVLVPISIGVICFLIAQLLNSAK